MSSGRARRREARGGRRSGRLRSSRRVTSIARSIALNEWARRLVGFVLLDLVLVAVMLGAFVVQCVQQLPPEALAGGWGGWRLAEGVTAGFTGSLRNLWDMTFAVTLTDGSVQAFALADRLAFTVPAAVVLLVWQVLDLLDGPFAVRRIRLKLKPLNDLALTAETLGKTAAAGAGVGTGTGDQAGKAGAGAQAQPGVGIDQISALEAAIERVSAESPHVETGDQDLRSIEVALNGLLRRMQEAKLQQMRFVSDASHELRTPIAVIQGYVGMLDRWGKTDPEVLEESIEALKAESDHMQQLVEQLLFLARGDSGRNTLQRAPFNMAAVVREVWEESKMIDPAHEYVCNLAPGDEENPAFALAGDAAMVKQSMRTMVQNAARYSEAGRTVELGVGASADGVAYTVQDEGIGIGAEQIAHVFDWFWRSDQARDRAAGGTGLGLSIAKWIVDAHDGRIEVLSHEGVGTRFTVTLPRGE